MYNVLIYAVKKILVIQRRINTKNTTAKSIKITKKLRNTLKLVKHCIHKHTKRCTCIYLLKCVN